MLEVLELIVFPGGERPPVPGVAADDDAGWAGGEVLGLASSGQPLMTSKLGIDAADLLVRTYFLQVILLFALMIPCSTSIAAWDHFAGLVGAGHQVAGGAVIMNRKCHLLHVHDALTVLISRKNQNILSSDASQLYSEKLTLSQGMSTQTWHSANL